MTNRN